MLASISKLSELSGLDRRTISTKLADTPSRAGPKNSKLYDVAGAMRTLFAGAATPDGEALDPQTERALLDRERRRSIEMANAKAAGSLLEASVVSETWSHHILIAKGRLLAIPNRLAPVLVAMGDMRAIEQTIRDEIYQALTELSTDEPPANTAD